MSKIFAGKYKSSTTTEFKRKPKSIISKGEQRLKDHNQKIQGENAKFIERLMLSHKKSAYSTIAYESQHK